jgi:hypothetical protein
MARAKDYTSLVDKFSELVKQEEARIEALHRKAFSKLHNIPSHPSKVVGVTYGSTKYDKASYQYLRQRYYRLQRIEAKSVTKAVEVYKFNDYSIKYKDFMKHHGIENTKAGREVDRLFKSMSQKAKQYFIEEHLNYDLRAEYEEMQEDAQEGEDRTLTALIMRLEYAINKTKR